MEALTYYLKANLVFIALFAIYHVALRRETWFSARRAWLLATAVLSLLLPLLPSLPGEPVLLAFDLPESVATPADAPLASIDWMGYLLYAHLGVSIALLLLLAVRCAKAFRSLGTAVSEPVSFFHIVRIPANTGGNDRDTLVAHERVHVQQGHSFDVLAYEIVSAIFWSNPLWRIALRELRLVHEHTADAIARGSHRNYDELLLAHALGVPTTSLLNTFGSSDIKKRIIMLHNTRSPRLCAPQTPLRLPALLVATLLASGKLFPAHPLPRVPLMRSCSPAWTNKLNSPEGWKPWPATSVTTCATRRPPWRRRRKGPCTWRSP